MSTDSDPNIFFKQLRSSNPKGIHDRFSLYLGPILLSSADVDIDDLTKFQTFLKGCLRILSTRLSKPKKFKYSKDILNEIFQVYQLCLRSFDATLSRLGNLDDSLGYYVKFIECLRVGGRVDDAEKYGLAQLNVVYSNPVIHANSHCKVLKIYLSLLKIGKKSTTTDDEHCVRLLQFMNKAKACQGLNCQECENLHADLVETLCVYAYTLLKKMTFSDSDVGINLCRTILSEFMHSPVIKTQVYQVSNIMCSHLFKLSKNHSYVTSILDCIAPGVVEVEEGNSRIEFVKVVCKCARHCSELEVRDFCVEFARYLNKKANDYTNVKAYIEPILRTIAMGLELYCIGTNFEDYLKTLFGNVEILKKSLRLFSSMCTYIQTNNKSSTTEVQHLKDQSLDYETSMAYLSPSISCLSLLCCLLSKSIRKCGWNQHLGNAQGGVLTDMLTTIMDMFHVNCRLILSFLSVTSEKKPDEKSWLVEVACGAFFISTISELKLQESTQIIKEIFGTNWIKKEEIQNLIKWLNDGCIALQDNNNKKQVLSLRYEVFWLFVNSHPSNLSQDTLERFSSDTYNMFGMLLSLLYDIDYIEMEKKVTEFLENWCTVRDRLKNLPTPVPIMKTWVECQCKYQLLQDHYSFDSNTLYDLLSSSQNVSKRDIGLLMEQEYNAYVSKENEFKSFCKKMRLKITAFFMTHIYTSPEKFIEKTKAQPTKRIANCPVDNVASTCLSHTIRIMEIVFRDEKMSSEANLINHHLYVAHGLLALCKLEANQYLERTFEDGKALFESIMIMIYNMFDLLQLKGVIGNNITTAYKLITGMQNLRNFSFENQLTLLWEGRRLSHPVCISPLNWSLIQQSLDTTELQKSESCIDCLKKNKSGFKQNFCFLFEESHTDAKDQGRFFQADISDIDIKKAAMDLSSKDPIERHSTFLAGYLYHDLCQKLVANGKLMEALLLAKEAHKLHSILFNSMFKGERTEEDDFTTDDLMEMIMLAAEDILPFSSPSRDLDKTYISPWKILQCYLESTLLVGRIYEMIGDGAEAVAHLQLGKKISSSVNSPLFIVAFSSLLGKLYTQQQNLKLAEKELELAYQLLETGEEFSCLKCKLVLQATVIEYLADLRQKKSDACEKIDLGNHERNLYELALKKLTDSEWTNPISGLNSGSLVSVECSCAGSENTNEEKAEKSPKRAKRTESLVTPGSEVMSHSISQVSQPGCTSYLTCSKDCSFSKMGCWHCLPSEVVKSGLLNDLINLKWEFIRRKISMNLLARSGKYFENSNKIDEVQKSLLRRISVLVGKNALQYTFSSIAPDHFRHLVGLGTTNDIFAIERAEIIHDICWHVMKYDHSDSVSKIFSNQSSITLEEITYWLIQAFVRSGDVPVVSQEVSKLLTVIFQSPSLKPSSRLLVSNDLSKECCTFYFHQASIGRHVSSQFLSDAFEGPNIDVSPKIKEKTLELLRLPKTIEDLKKHVTMFFDGLPPTTIICISVLGHEYKSLLKKFGHATDVEAWMLISQRSARAEAVVELLPLNPILGDMSAEYKKTTKLWVCPWGNTTVDKIAPIFKNISQQYYYMLREILSSNPEREFVLSRAASFDEQLRTFLSDIENLWLGSSKCLSLQDVVDPITLMLDYEVQMLPWEKLSALKNKEVYRMPSVGSMLILLDKCNIDNKEQVENNLTPFPSIDPLCGYFVLNPDGTLKRYESIFKEYFEEKKLKGMTNSKPNVEELVVALGSHDTFYYFGHGSGKKYIPDDKIKKLKKCSAAFLMGCASGCLTLQGCYAPVGTPLSYLRAGSPFVVANLWIMLESELCLFAETLLKEILKDLGLSSKSDRRRIGVILVKACSSFILPAMSWGSLVCYGLPAAIHNSKAEGI